MICTVILSGTLLENFSSHSSTAIKQVRVSSVSLLTKVEAPFKAETL